jgi:hypothetical protein
MAPGYLPTGATTEATTWPLATYQQGPPLKLLHGPWLLTNKGHHRSYCMAPGYLPTGATTEATYYSTWPLPAIMNRGHHRVGHMAPSDQLQGPPQKLLHLTRLLAPNNRGHQSDVSPWRPTNRGHHRSCYKAPKKQPTGATTELLPPNRDHHRITT